ncbi:MAG: PASTA domain-containing protein [Prevotella sp.]|nr:PASTA domain-containing protein [Prevotella sp.]
MKTKEFFGKFLSGYLLGNLLAMVVVIVLLCFGVKYGLDWYTHHGQGIVVPKVEGMTYMKAYTLVEQNGLRIMVTDSGYNKRLPANCILAQSPGEGTKVKEGHTIYVTVNSPSSPSFAIPDVVDNSSLREAEAKLMAIGFKLLPPKYVPGEKDWVYGIVSHGRRVSTGDMVSIDSPLTLMVGSGMYDEENDNIDYLEPGFQQFLQSGDDNIVTDDSDIDEFEEVTEP